MAGDDKFACKSLVGGPGRSYIQHSNIRRKLESSTGGPLQGLIVSIRTGYSQRGHIGCAASSVTDDRIGPCLLELGSSNSVGVDHCRGYAKIGNRQRTTGSNRSTCQS